MDNQKLLEALREMQKIIEADNNGGNIANNDQSENTNATGGRRESDTNNSEDTKEGKQNLITKEQESKE